MSNIMDYMEKLPKDIPEKVKQYLGLNIIDRDHIQKTSVELAARGLLGMVPIAVWGFPFAPNPPRQECALRLLPQVSMDQVTVAICFDETSKARTIAPNIRDFSAGVLAYSASRAHIPIDEIKQELISFAEEWGDSSNTKAILEVYSSEASEEAALLKACKENEYFEVFSELLEEDKTYLTPKIQRLLEKYPNNKMLYSVYADRLIRFDKEVDASDVVWNMIKEDIVCDSYIIMRSPTWIPMTHAIRWFIANGDKSYTKEYPALYEAARIWVESDHYNGDAHLSFAKDIAETNPRLAYIQASNAAAIYATSEHKAPIEAIAFAEELARKNQWNEISEALGWARRSL